MSYIRFCICGLSYYLKKFKYLIKDFELVLKDCIFNLILIKTILLKLFRKVYYNF